MTPFVNLLPWRPIARQQRRKLRLRIMVSVMIVVIGGGWGGWEVLHRHLATLQYQGRELEVLLAEREKTLQGRLDVGGLNEECISCGARSDRQYQVSRWGEFLSALADTLPEHSWLKSIRWQSGNLILEGHTSDIGDLEKVARTLAQLPGGGHIKAGPVSYQSGEVLTYMFILENIGGQRVIF